MSDRPPRRYSEEEVTRADLTTREVQEREFERGISRLIAEGLGEEPPDLDHPKPVDEVFRNLIRLIDGSSTLLLDRSMGGIVAERLLMLWDEGQVEHTVHDEKATQYLQRLSILPAESLEGLYGGGREFSEGFIARIESLLAERVSV